MTRIGVWCLIRLFDIDDGLRISLQFVASIVYQALRLCGITLREKPREHIENRTDGEGEQYHWDNKPEERAYEDKGLVAHRTKTSKRPTERWYN